MRWDFSVQVGPTITADTSPVALAELQIIKTLYDDNNVELTSVVTTAEDAYANAEAGFLEEYRVTAYNLLSAQLEIMFSQQDTYRPSLPSLGVAFGSIVRNSLLDVVIVANGRDA